MSNKFLNLFKKDKRQKNYLKYVFGVMLIGGIAALIAAFVLTVDKFIILQNPGTVLSCSVNIVVNCSTVMQS